MGESTSSSVPNESPLLRPSPQRQVRDCGHAFSTPKPIGNLSKSTWGTYYRAPIGGRLLLGRASAPIWATGMASRSSLAATHRVTIATDPTLAELSSTLMLPTKSSLAPLTYSNAVSQLNPVISFWSAPTETVLTYAVAWGDEETGWFLSNPTATTSAPDNSLDEFVRILVAGRYFGYQMALSFPDVCSVGALSDALGEPANIAGHRGIFDPTKRDAAEASLLRNGVDIYVRVVGNKQDDAIDDLLSTTKCTTGNLIACAKLLDDLESRSNAILTNSNPSDLSKLQADTDPTWSPILLGGAKVSILNR